MFGRLKVKTFGKSLRLTLIASSIIFCCLFFTGCSVFLTSPTAVEYGSEGVLIHRRVLLVAAHQDDDVFIVSRLREHILCGDTIFVVWTAISSQVGPEYAEKRVAESKTAMTLLGVDTANCFYLRHEDGNTQRNVEEIVTEVFRALSAVKPDVIYVPAYEGGHIDHDIANFTTVQAVKMAKLTCPIFEFPLYSAKSTFCLFPFRMRKYPASIPTTCRRLSENEYQFVLDYWKIYSSQHFPLGWYIDFISGKRSTFGYEYIRRIPTYNYLQKPCRGSVAYERYLKVNFEDFSGALQKYYAGKEGHHENP